MNCDDWRRWETKSDCLGTNGIYFGKLRASFGSIWGVCGAIRAIWDGIWTFVVDLWRLQRVEMIAGTQSQSHTTIIGSQCDCYIAIFETIAEERHWFELSTANCDDLKHLGNDWEGFVGDQTWKVSATMSSAPFCGDGRRNLGDGEQIMYEENITFKYNL